VLPRTLKARSRPTDTTLQRHVSFFDDNGDRGVDVTECARGLRALGLPFGVAEAAAFAIVLPLSLQTRGSLLAMNVDIDEIQKGKHDGDTGILDKRGRFVARRFEAVFGARSTVDRNGDRAFTATELNRMINANRETLAGYVAATAEWQLLLALGADTVAVEGGKSVPALSVGRMKSFYDGTLFYKLAKERASSRHRSVSGQKPGADEVQRKSRLTGDSRIRGLVDGRA
jgi:hypothetical protein